MMTSSKDYARRFDYRTLLHSVVDVLAENKRNGDSDTVAYTVSADAWGINSRLRDEVFERVSKHWSRRTEFHADLFPYNVDCVVSVYFRYRKRGADWPTIEQMRRSIDGDSPSK